MSYDTYNEAINAEKIAMNFSTIGAYKASIQDRGCKRVNENTESDLKHKKSKAVADDKKQVSFLW